MTNKTIEAPPVRIGLLVNPFAGAGGPAAKKGSDSLETHAAVLSGAIDQRASQRARQFIHALQKASINCTFYVPKGAMGEDYFLGSGLTYEIVKADVPMDSSAEDTMRLTKCLISLQVDILIFIGGDGTARDICSVVQHQLPVLGVPSGVKMHSGVFALTPLAAAKVLNDLVSGDLVSLVEREVRDIDEVAFRQGIVKSRYYGSLWVPDELRYIQSVKQGGMEVDELVLLDIAAEIRERLDDEENAGALVIFAGGSTTQFVQQEMGCEGTLLGVDIIRDQELIHADVSAPMIEDLVSEFTGKVILVLTAIGGQGHVIGRGNQQLTPQVLRRIGRDNIWLIATKAKLKGLAQRPLVLDTNDPDLDRDWQDLIPVITGYQDQVLYRVGLPSDE